MIPVKPLTQEQLIYYLLQNVNLGTYDRRFLANTMQLNITANKPVTTNQAALLNKITLRYARQLAKNELDANALSGLPWTNSPTPSLPEFTEIFVYVEDDLIKIKSPYKSEFVKGLKDLKFLVWQRENRTWHTIYNEYNLRAIIKLVKHHFNEINFCDEIENALRTVDQYMDVKYWDPTLVQRQNRLYTLATTASLDEAIQDIPLEVSLKSFARLTYYGIMIDHELVKDLHNQMGNTKEAQELISFSTNHTSSMELSDTDKLISSLSAIGTDYVVMSELFGVNSAYINKMCDSLRDNNIQYEVIGRKKTDISATLDFKKYKLPVIINTGTWRYNINKKAAKMINLVNSQPINAYGNK